MTDETESTEETETAEVEGQPEDISSLFDEGAEHPEGEASEKGEAETEESEDDQAESEETDEETGESEETEESESETPSEEEGSVPRKALLDERRKRQELEEQVRQLEPADEEAPDPTDDPEGYEKYLRQKWEREQWQKTANRSRERMIESHPDYEEKEKYFLFLASQDSDLIRQMNEDPDPAAFAYKTAKESLDKQEKAIEERVVARLRKEGKLKEEKSEKPAESASRVSELTSATGAGKNTGEEPIKESVDPQDVFDDLSY